MWRRASILGRTEETEQENDVPNGPFQLTDREEAVMLVLTAFETAGDERINTPSEVTMAQGHLALRALSVTREELLNARRALGWAST